MDQGVIRNLKHYYCKRLVNKITAWEQKKNLNQFQTILRKLDSL